MKAKAGIASLVVVLLATPLVVRHEGVVLGTYLDPVKIPTACVGETDRSITMRERFNRDECVAVMGASLLEHAKRLEVCIQRPLKDNEAAAVLSWAYNVGTEAACSSTLVRKINEGAPASEWCPQLSRWDKAGGRVLPGLTKRRAAERAMCEGKG